jgi:hypothetical protein
VSIAPHRTARWIRDAACWSSRSVQYTNLVRRGSGSVRWYVSSRACSARIVRPPASVEPTKRTEQTASSIGSPVSVTRPATTVPGAHRGLLAGQGRPRTSDPQRSPRVVTRAPWGSGVRTVELTAAPPAARQADGLAAPRRRRGRDSEVPGGRLAGGAWVGSDETRSGSWFRAASAAGRLPGATSAACTRGQCRA